MPQEPESHAMQPAAVRSWSDIWISALTKPSVNTFEEIVNDPNASTSRGYRWVFLAGLVASALTSLISMVIIGFQGADSPDTSGIAALAGGSLLQLVCFAPVAAVLSVIGLMISAGITQFFAGALGGTGSYSRLVYAFAAYAAPLSLVTGVVSPIPLVNCVAIPLGLFGLVLNVIANKAVNQFSWERAIASSVIFIVGILVLVAVLVIVILALLGPAIGDIFSDIVQNI